MISVFGTEIAAAQMRKLAKTTHCCSVVVAEIKFKILIHYKARLWLKIWAKNIKIATLHRHTIVTESCCNLLTIGW